MYCPYVSIYLKLTPVQEVASTSRPGALAIIGGFGGELDLNEAGYSNGGILVRHFTLSKLSLRPSC